jgi:hypothetical protein
MRVKQPGVWMMQARARAHTHTRTHTHTHSVYSYVQRMYRERLVEVRIPRLRMDRAAPEHGHVKRVAGTERVIHHAYQISNMIVTLEMVTRCFENQISTRAYPISRQCWCSAMCPCPQPGQQGRLSGTWCSARGTCNAKLTIAVLST